MITQKVKSEVTTTVSSVIAEIGNGDVGISLMSANDPQKVFIGLSNIEKSEVGEKIGNDKVTDTPIILAFNSVAGIQVLNKVVQRALQEMKVKEDAAKRAALPHFMVSLDKIMVLSSFKNTNPSAEKVVKCQKHLAETGKLDEAIDVNSTLTLTDGYVRYLVASYNGLEKVEVVASDGITIKVGDKKINFTSDKIEIAYNLVKDEKDGEDKFCLIILNDGKRYEIPAVDNEVAAKMVKKITDVFEAKVHFQALSTLNYGLFEKLEELGVNASYAKSGLNK